MTDQLNQYPDILSDFSEDELVTNQYTVHTTDHSGSSSHTSLQASNPVTENSLCVGMSFDTKESTVSCIKQYHIDNGYRFVVVESKSEKFICRCVDYKKGCPWRLRAPYSKRSLNWEIRKIDGSHTCLSTMQPADHVNLDSNQIGSIVMNSVKENPSIPIKSLIAEIKNCFGYSVSYDKAWNGKQKALAKEFGDWEESYNKLPRWYQAVQQSNPGTIIQCTGSPVQVSGQLDPSCYIMERVFWSFGPCIQGFNYCKPVVQVDRTFMTGRYQGTLLTTLAQDGSRNIFPLAFAIVEGETKEALIWFFQLLREHVTPQSNLYLITDRGKGILATLQSEEVQWEADGLQSVYCIHHIASNFNKKFKNHELKNQLKNMGNNFFSFIHHIQ